MRDKNCLLRELNMRAIKASVFGVLCRWPRLRDWLNYYTDTIALAEAGEPGSLQTLEIRPVTEYGLVFQPSELRDILKCSATEMDLLTVRFITGRLRNAVILGSSGVTIDGRSGRVVGLATGLDGVPRNWRIARRLRVVEGDPAATYINLLGVRRGHRHFAHFFWDTLVPLMVYLKNWHDPAERVTCLVREDLSPIQRDAFRFLADDHAGVSFRALGAREKMRCANMIHLAFQNRSRGKDNALARNALTDLRDLFLKHYGIGSPRTRSRRRVYISRNDAAIRRVLNEPEVTDYLERHGFEFHQPGRMPFREQAELFHTADLIVAPHGAALANLMFCRPKTTVLEIFPANFIDEGFLKLAKAMDLEYRHLIAGAGDYFQNFAIDPQALAATQAVEGACELSRDSTVEPGPTGA